MEKGTGSTLRTCRQRRMYLYHPREREPSFESPTSAATTTATALSLYQWDEWLEVFLYTCIFFVLIVGLLASCKKQILVQLFFNYTSSHEIARKLKGFI